LGATCKNKNEDRQPEAQALSLHAPRLLCLVTSLKLIRCHAPVCSPVRVESRAPGAKAHPTDVLPTFPSGRPLAPRLPHAIDLLTMTEVVEIGGTKSTFGPQYLSTRGTAPHVRPPPWPLAAHPSVSTSQSRNMTSFLRDGRIDFHFRNLVCTGAPSSWDMGILGLLRGRFSKSAWPLRVFRSLLWIFVKCCTYETIRLPSASLTWSLSPVPGPCRRSLALRSGRIPSSSREPTTSFSEQRHRDTITTSSPPSAPRSYRTTRPPPLMCSGEPPPPPPPPPPAPPRAGPRPRLPFNARHSEACSPDRLWRAGPEATCQP